MKSGISIRRSILLSLLAVGLFLPLVFSFALARPAQNQATTFINVGEGDSALLSDGSGFNVLIDGGKPEQGTRVDTFLHQHGIRELNVIMASHADSDHIGGLLSVLQDPAIQVNQVLYNGYPGSTATWDSFAQAVADKGLTLTPVQFPQVLTWGGMTAHILNPEPGLLNPDTNDASIVARVDYGSTAYLFTGDINTAIESTVVARGTPVAAQILKVAHHGSASSTGASFLAAVQPQDGIISVGPNAYGHPSAQTISRLATAGARSWRTDWAGDIMVIDDGATYSVSLQHPFLWVYLPLILAPLPPAPTETQTPTFTPTATETTPTPPPGANVSCSTSGSAQICAWVSNPAPAKNATETVTGRLMIDNLPQAAQSMTATWYFKSSTSTCQGATGADGVASCIRQIGGATAGFQVNVDVSIGDYTATTWFIPN